MKTIKTVKKIGKDKIIESGSLVTVKESKEDIEEIEAIENIRRSKGLTVPGLAALFSEGKTIPEVKALYNCSYQAVHQFVAKHARELEALADSDKVLSYKLLNTVHGIIDSIDERDCKKAGLQSKLTAVGIAIDKARLLQDKSTANVQSLSKIIASADESFLASLGINKPDQA